MAEPELTPEEIRRRAKYERHRERLRSDPERRRKHNEYQREYLRRNPKKAEEALERHRQYRRDHPEEVRARERISRNNWRKGNPEALKAARARHRSKFNRFAERPAGRISVMMTDAKGRAKRRGLEFDERLRAKFRESPPVNCPCCGIAFNYALNRYDGSLRRSPSLDRFDNSKGYTLENCEIICHRCNSLKSDATVEEIERVAAWMRSRLSLG